MNGSLLNSGAGLRLPVMLAVAALTSVLSSNAGAVFSVVTDNTVNNVVDDVTQFAVTGADMSGMVVTVFYTNNTSESAVWAPTGGTSGAAVGAGFSLSNADDTFTTNWVLRNTNPLSLDPIGITGFQINAQIGAVVFDKIVSPDLTTGSEPGSEFLPDVINNAIYTGEATYSQQISRSGPPENGVPQGDLYGILDVLITDGPLEPSILPAIPGTTIGEFNFMADTDLISQAVPEASQVLAMALVGLISGGVWWKRRRVAAVG